MVRRCSCSGIISVWHRLLRDQLYRDAHIAALTPFSYADSVTQDNPYYFRVQVTNSFQGRWMVEYIRHVFELPARLSGCVKEPTIQLVYSDDVFGKTFHRRRRARRKVAAPDLAVAFDATAKNLEQSSHDVAGRLAKEEDPRIIVIGAAPEGVDVVLKALRRRGIRTMAFAAGGSASEALRQGIAGSARRSREIPGFFIDNFFVAASIILDSAGSEAQNFAARYLRRHGVTCELCRRPVGRR